MIAANCRYGLIEKMTDSPRAATTEELAALIGSDDAVLWREIFAAASEVKRRCGRDRLLKRALIETANVCAKDCLYCGIRKSNREQPRYRMTIDEVADCVARARAEGFNAVAFQSGEIESEENTRYYEDVLKFCEGLEVTLSLGEQTEEVYRRWKDAGAMRYLLRIETSNRELYASLHPAECSFDRRVGCVRSLKRTGYITGTGVMIGIPGQTILDLARDICFFSEMEADMVGMGPWIPHPASPLASDGWSPEWAFETSLKMIALTRLCLHNVNIVAATALDALEGAVGRERALQAGANVVMLNYTPLKYRAAYDLYPGKANA